MSQEALERARQLIRAKQYDQARAILVTIPQEPKAQEWISRIDEIMAGGSGQRSAPQITPEQRTLQQARVLIQQQKYPEARRILKLVSHNPQAQEWLARIDEFDPPEPVLDENSFEIPDLEAEAEKQPDEREVLRQQIKAQVQQPPLIADLVLRGYTDLIAGLIVALMAIGMIYSFMASDWISIKPIFLGIPMGEDLGGATAFELFTGKTSDDNDVSLALDETGTIGGVRFIERLLILIPIASVILIGIALLMLTVKKRTNFVMAMALISLVLFGLPFVWESMSTSNWRSPLEDALKTVRNAEVQEQQALLEALGMGRNTGNVDDANALLDVFMEQIIPFEYSTTEQKIWGGVAALVSIIALSLALMREAGIFDPPKPKKPVAKVAKPQA